ncbi:hypothetical protein D3C86_1969650 [compost metagenome]
MPTDVVNEVRVIFNDYFQNRHPGWEKQIPERFFDDAFVLRKFQDEHAANCRIDKILKRKTGSYRIGKLANRIFD